ncbi:MAG: SAM-dependent chlorinase/fluorinase [Alphaproteobacteria bacterium]|nr:SAM-dependent chlorinase/fluorinase [Alphaproteobacteria bacterium]
MIALFTDFGLAGPYTGQIQAVLHQTAPGVPVISLFADAPTGQPKPSAYLLAAYAGWFPAGTVFVGVVDPGVGSERRAIIVEADGRFFVGPDNGLFEIARRRVDTSRVWQIGWRPAALSASFHGRDLFAPVAARLATGELPSLFGGPIEPLHWLEWPDDLPEIVYIDHYGNALSGLRGASVAADAALLIGEHRIRPARTFSAVPEGAPFWYINSNGLVEIAVNRGRADRTLALGIGSPIVAVA